MPRRRLQRRNFARWTAIGLIFSVAVGFAFVVLADDDRLETPLDLEEENLTSETSESSIPELGTSQVQPEPTLPFEVTEVQNQAPKISLEDLDCWTEMPELSDLVTIQIVVEDPDDETITLDLGVLIDERVVDISGSILPAPELSGSGKTQAIFSLPTGVKNYVHLIAHATDSSGAQSEAALILPQNSENCNSE
tara:strand:+ start:758 stop:1339 length:582 start_codon:yes stop_codon:yes gene_type:complete